MASYKLRSERSEQNVEKTIGENVRYDNDSMLNIRKIYW